MIPKKPKITTQKSKKQSYLNGQSIFLLLLILATVGIVIFKIKQPQNWEGTAKYWLDGASQNTGNEPKKLSVDYAKWDETAKKLQQLPTSLSANENVLSNDPEEVFKRGEQAKNNINLIKEKDPRLLDDNAFKEEDYNQNWWDLLGLNDQKVNIAGNEQMTVKSSVGSEKIEMNILLNKENEEESKAKLLSSNDFDVQMNLVDSNIDKNRIKSYQQGNFLLYEQDQSISVQYELGENILKESIVISIPPKSNVLSYEVTCRDKCVLTKDVDGGILINNEKDQYLGKFFAPTIVDRKKNMGNIVTEISEDNKIIKYIIDNEYLKKAEYPLVFDPVYGTPETRYESRMVWDDVHNQLIMFGGTKNTSSGIASYNDTWIYKNKQWQKMNLSNAPAPRRGFDMVWDHYNKRVVLFGGEYPDGNNPVIYSDLWFYYPPDNSYPDGRWQLQTRNSENTPGPLSYHRMVYDYRNQAIRLMGGFKKYSSSANKPEDINGNLYLLTITNVTSYDWTLVNSNGPQVAHFGLAWDNVADRLTVFGGIKIVPQ